MEALIRKVFASACSPKRLQDIIVQMKAVTKGIKPAFLLEGRSKIDSLSRFIEELNSIADHTFVVMTLNNFHTFIGRVDSISSVLQKAQRGEVVFIDVSEKLAEPVVIDKVSDVENLNSMLENVESVINLATANEPLNLEFDEESWNGCSLTGVLCGFPTVYYFDPAHGNCLSMISLTQIEATQDSFTVSSFTLPAMLMPGLQEIVKRWSLPFEGVNQRTVIFDGPVAM